LPDKPDLSHQIKYTTNMKYVVYSLAFLIEITVWASLSSLGFSVGNNKALHWVVAALLFTGVTVFWGIFMSPKAAKRLALMPFYLVKLLAYSGTFWILWHHDKKWAMVFVLLMLVSEPFLVGDERSLS